MSAARSAVIVLAREIRAEMRTRELLQTTIVFTLIVVTLFNFAFEPTAEEARRFGPGLIWITLLFAGSLMLNPSFSKELANDTLYALRMSPASSFAILLGKILANMIFLGVTEMVLIPAFSILYNVSVLPVVAPLILILLLGTFGLVVVGTVFSAIATQARLREVLLPVLLLPVVIPVLFSAVEATAGLFGSSPELDRTWMSVLIAFDIVFFTAAWLMSDHLLEE